MKKDIIKLLKQSGLTGRGGAGFPTWQKWQAVKTAKAKQRFVICNASEGEPLVFKDKFIFEHYPEEVINGIKIALKTIHCSRAYIYINKEYYGLFGKKLKQLVGKLPVELFQKPGGPARNTSSASNVERSSADWHSDADGYLAGEETTLLNAIEDKPLEPRLKPPYPTQVGLFGCPTLINNVETFYWVSKIAKGEYQGNRFYSIASDPSTRSGQAPNPGVFELPENYTIEQILRDTKNLPSFPFYIQAGGAVSGEILLPSELNRPLKSIGALVIYNKTTTNPLSLMQKWAEFFLKENCDKCTPCREGIFRIAEILQKAQNEPSQQSQSKMFNETEKEKLNDIFLALEKTSFCPLGRMAVQPFKTAIEKLL